MMHGAYNVKLKWCVIINLQTYVLFITFLWTKKQHTDNTQFMGYVFTDVMAQTNG